MLATLEGDTLPVHSEMEGLASLLKIHISIFSYPSTRVNTHPHKGRYLEMILIPPFLDSLLRITTVEVNKNLIFINLTSKVKDSWG